MESCTEHKALRNISNSDHSLHTQNTLYLLRQYSYKKMIYLHLHFLRTIITMLLFISCIILSFKGFPLALVSFLGSGMTFLGYSVAIATMTHSDTAAGNSPTQRILMICIHFGLASLGVAVIQWGGLSSINIGIASIDLTIDLKTIAVVTGVISGLLNMDSKVNFPNYP